MLFDTGYVCGNCGDVLLLPAITTGLSMTKLVSMGVYIQRGTSVHLPPWLAAYIRYRVCSIPWEGLPVPPPLTRQNPLTKILWIPMLVSK